MHKPPTVSARSRSRYRTVSLLAVALGLSAFAGAQVPTFGSNAQHTNLYTAPAKEMNKIRWQKTIDETNAGFFGHYGAPLITANNTVITSVTYQDAGLSFPSVRVSAFDGADGTHKYDLTTDWLFPPHNWTPVYNPVLVGNRLYYAGAGGTLLHVDDANTNSPSAPIRECFFGLANYQNDPDGFNSTVYIDTPLTADSAGNIYFGFRIAHGSAPAPLSTSVSGYAKVDSSGNGIYAFVSDMTSDGQISLDCHNTAPALSNDESKIYVVAKWNTNAYYAYLVALNTSDLSTSSKVFLTDPRNGNNAGALDDGTASPMVGPDGDVYLGTFANPYNGSRGFLSHFSGDLSQTKIPGGFGWDYTPGIVPSTMIPSYNGTSSYLLFCKYNNYLGVGDGSGVNRVAVIDPNAVETDANPSGNGVQIMREVQTVIGFTPDEENPDVVDAVREMCVNATCVNPATNSVFFNSEDGRAYRWDLAANQVTQSLSLTPGFGEPYVPSVIGPDGTVYTLNGGQLFAMGQEDGDSIALSSDKSDSRLYLNTDSITFTAHVAPAPPSGVPGVPVSITFTDNYYDGFSYISNPLGSFPVDGSGNAHVSTTLTAGGTILGNHFITAHYSGNGSDDPADVTLVQKVHALATSSSFYDTDNTVAYGDPYQITAQVQGVGTEQMPTGQVTFLSDNKVIGQVPLDSEGKATFTANGLEAGVRDVQAFYQSDTWFASSSTINEVTVTEGTSTIVSSSPNPSSYGSTITFTATVSPNDVGAGTPTGSVIFTIDGVASAPVSVDGSGQATLSASTLDVGTHTVSAAFTGTNGWGNSEGSGSDQNVTADTDTSIGSSLNPSTVGDSVTFTATVTGPSGAGVPTGSVVFTVDGVAGSPVTLDGSGQATLTTSSLTQATHTVSAAFTGTGGWNNSGNASLDQVVNGGSGPSQPTGVGVDPGPGKNKVTVHWNASSEPGGTIDHYEIWRSTKPNGSFSLVGTTAGLTFTDNVGNKQTRYFYVVAVDSHGVHSDPSAVASGTSPAVQTNGKDKN